MPDDAQSSVGQSLSPEAEETAVLEQFKADYSRFDGDETPQTKQPAEQVSAKESERATEPAEKQPNKADDSTAEDAKPDNPEVSADPDKPASSYQARKSERDRLIEDQKRLAKNWQEFSEGKLKWQQEQNEKLARLEQQLVQRSQQQPNQGDARFSAQEFQRASEWYEAEAEKAVAEGDVDKAKDMLGKSRQTRMAAQQQYQREWQQQQQQGTEKFVTEYRAQADKVILEHPELQKEGNTLWPKMQELLDKMPVFTSHPEGFRWAYEFAKRDMDAVEVSGLREQLQKEREGKQKLEERTQLKGGTLTKPPSADMSDMGDEELEANLRRNFVQNRSFSGS